MTQYFTFCYIWVFGGNLHDSSLQKFNDFTRNLLSDAMRWCPEKNWMSMMCDLFLRKSAAYLTWSMWPAWGRIQFQPTSSAHDLGLPSWPRDGFLGEVGCAIFQVCQKYSFLPPCCADRGFHAHEGIWHHLMVWDFVYQGLPSELDTIPSCHTLIA